MTSTQQDLDKLDQRPELPAADRARRDGFDSARIADPTFFAHNRLAPHSDHRWFASSAEAAAAVSSFEQNLNGWMTSFLAKEGLKIQDISSWAIHPGGPRILDACLTALSLPGEAVAASREILARYGNMSSATVLFLLNELKHQPIHGPVVALGFGPGLTIEAMLLHSAD